MAKGENKDKGEVWKALEQEGLNKKSDSHEENECRARNKIKRSVELGGGDSAARIDSALTTVATYSGIGALLKDSGQEGGKQNAIKSDLIDEWQKIYETELAHLSKRGAARIIFQRQQTIDDFYSEGTIRKKLKTIKKNK